MTVRSNLSEPFPNELHQDTAEARNPDTSLITKCRPVTFGQDVPRAASDAGVVEINERFVQWPRPVPWQCLLGHTTPDRPDCQK